MACMEHNCPNCGAMEFNNRSTMLCPKCGEKMRASFDEADDDHDYPEIEHEANNGK